MLTLDLYSFSRQMQKSVVRTSTTTNHGYIFEHMHHHPLQKIKTACSNVQNYLSPFY